MKTYGLGGFSQRGVGATPPSPDPKKAAPEGAAPLVGRRARPQLFGALFRIQSRMMNRSVDVSCGRPEGMFPPQGGVKLIFW